MFTPLLDRILNPASTDSRLPLLKLPFGGRVVYLNSFVPRSIHYVGTVFGVALIFLFVVKAVAEYLGIVEIQHVGQAATTDLRNRIYEKLVRQPIGFFQTQTTGRLMSTVINDVDRARSTLSDTLSSFFQYLFTFASLCRRLAADQLENGPGFGDFCPHGAFAGRESSAGESAARSSPANRASANSTRFCRKRSAATAS